MFLEDGEDDDDEDAFDAFEAAQKRRSQHRRGDILDDDDDDDFDDDEDDDDDAHESFLVRHVRSIVTIVLLLMLVAGLAVFALSDSGQRTLARLNVTLPLKSEVYGRLGYESYQAGDFAQAGARYERALARDPGSYDYASSAAMAYVALNETDKAAAMLKRCVELKPTAVEPYIYLLNLYPDVTARPWEIAQLLQQGYEQTGDARLKPAT